MSREVCGVCWTPYDDGYKCACPTPALERMNCPRCGKVTRDGDVHTCTPKALVLANSAHLGYRVGWQREVAAELRRLHEENERLNAVHQRLRGVTMRLMMHCNDLEMKLDEDGEHPAMVKAREALTEKL